MRYYNSCRPSFQAAERVLSSELRKKTLRSGVSLCERSLFPRRTRRASLPFGGGAYLLLPQFEQSDARLVDAEPFLVGLVSQFLQSLDLVMVFHLLLRL